MFLDEKKLESIGFKSFGTNVLISDKCSIYNPHLIEIGNNVRIDDFCILSPGSNLKIGSYIHVSCYSSLIGKGSFELEDFSGLSGRVSLYSSTDDFSGRSMTNPMIPEKFKKVRHGTIHIKKHAIIGTGSVILPNVTVGLGVSVHAMSIVISNCDDLSVYSGQPAKLLSKKKHTQFLEYEKKLLEEENK